jgi:hypothetical protein
LPFQSTELNLWNFELRRRLGGGARVVGATQPVPVLATPMSSSSCPTGSRQGAQQAGLVRDYAAQPQLDRQHAYGQQFDYFDHSNVVGWSRLGAPAGKAIAVLMSNGGDGWKLLP